MFRFIILWFSFLSLIQQNICKKHDCKVVARSCSINEHFLACGSDCGHTCDDVFTNSFNCGEKCTEGCFCEPGFYRDFNQKGRCVRSYECQTLKTEVKLKKGTKLCSHNQEFKCGSDCGHYCEDIGRNISCANNCDAGCYCREGYYRDSRINGQCFKEKHCKKNKQKKFNSKKREFVEWFKKHFPWKHDN